MLYTEEYWYKCYVRNLNARTAYNGICWLSNGLSLECHA